MKKEAALALAAIVIAGPSQALAAETREFEGVKAVAGSSLNPPDPNRNCELAKQAAKDKAKSAGYTGLSEWVRLSSDNDCKLHTEGGPTVAYMYIFTARGKFTK